MEAVFKLGDIVVVKAPQNNRGLNNLWIDQMDTFHCSTFQIEEVKEVEMGYKPFKYTGYKLVNLTGETKYPHINKYIFLGSWLEIDKDYRDKSKEHLEEIVDSLLEE